MALGLDLNWEIRSKLAKKALFENHLQDVWNSQNLRQQRMGPVSVPIRTTKTTCQCQLHCSTGEKGTTKLKTLHQNHLIHYYPKEESFPIKIEDCFP